MEFTPITSLLIEHRLIERMIELMKINLPRIKEKEGVDLDFSNFIESATDFMKTYADRCHHGKEEEILFERLAFKKLLPEHKKAMDDLVLEHIRARKILGELAGAREAFKKKNISMINSITTNISKFVEFYPAHVQKEEASFFEPSMEYFSQREQEEMLQKFWEFDKYLIHEKYIQIVEHFENKKSEL